MKVILCTLVAIAAAMTIVILATEPTPHPKQTVPSFVASEEVNPMGDEAPVYTTK